MAIRLSRTFVLRKLHQLSGIFPLGIFRLEHFDTNSKALSGPGDFNSAVDDLQSTVFSRMSSAECPAAWATATGDAGRLMRSPLA